MDELTRSITAIILATISVATLSVIVSKNANTSGVLTAAGNAYQGILSTALSPVTGGGATLGLSVPSFSING